jgi:hypothetical protein
MLKLCYVIFGLCALWSFKGVLYKWGILDVMRHNTKLSFSFILINHRLKLWNIKRLMWEECPTIANHFAFKICFFIAPYVATLTLGS